MNFEKFLQFWHVRCTPDQINLSKKHYIRLLESREEAREKLRCVLRQAGRGNEPLAEQAFASRLAGGSIT
jgi:hypothetical protein